MPTLIISNGQSIYLQGLAKNKPLPQLSQKRITTAVRAAIRQHYGITNVIVSCSADYQQTHWLGQCEIHGLKYDYKIK